jgi:SAM-dependent methyltransferase
MNSCEWQKAVEKTDRFYEQHGGFSYLDEQVDRWLGKWFLPFVQLAGTEHILDLCCADGCWTFGLLRRFPKLQITGADISGGAIRIADERAKSLGLNDQTLFLAHDCETSLPFPDSQFDLIFARGLFIFNQHNMMRPECLQLLERWHDKLKRGGRFVAMYGSKPERFGTYTPPEKTKGLPTNLCPRKTKAVDFRGGKFNHSPVSFLQPFLASSLNHINIAFYQFQHGRHTLITEKIF